MRVLVVFVCAVALASGAAIDPEVELPKGLKICRLNDPERDECIKESLQEFLPSLRQGIPHIEVPSLDPFSYEKATFNYENAEILKGTFTLRNVKTYGMSVGKVLRVKSKFDADKMQLKAELFFPKLFASGSYKSNVTVNQFVLQARGQYNATMKNLTARWNIKGKLEKINGEEYMKVHQFDVVPILEDLQMSISGLFPDENLNKVGNDFMNENWRQLQHEMIPETRKQWEPIFLDFANAFFSKIPFRRLLIKD